ncbi:hypothetical protein BH18ACT5_BH18ACT5_01610 [soil metagenome]
MQAAKRGWLLGMALAILTTGACATDSSTPTVTEPVAVTTTAARAIVYQPSNPAAVAAVEAFLSAEGAGDFESSFAFLSSNDQDEIGGVAAWVSEHYFLLPVVTGFTVTGEGLEDDAATLEVDLDLEAGLDEIIGLTPARAASTWTVIEEASTWRIRLIESSVHPIYPDDSTAPSAVSGWVEAGATCDPAMATAGQWDGGLLGTPELANEFCSSGGQVAVGEVQFLDDAAESAPFLAAFGPDVGVWARVVEVVDPVRLRAVVAPVGEQWVVIGVLEESD